MNTVDRGCIGPEEISTFSQVDAAGNPDSLVQFLDETAATHFSRINRTSLELMALREGASVLDIGCGTGDVVRAMRKLVGAQGAATGVDLSERMLDEALVRDQASILRSRFLVADAQDLPFPDRSFDACRASRLLVHVANAELALQEAIRVIRPGGRLVVIEPDFGTMALAHPDHGMTRTVLNAFCDSFANGTVGRWLTVWLKACGMQEIQCEPHAVRIGAHFLRNGFQIGRAVQRVADLKLGAPGRCDDFLRVLDDMAARGEFFCVTTVLMVSALRPSGTA
jgi:ubiquinone/menaquinone biosynthesis C-methylase UbiE